MFGIADGPVYGGRPYFMDYTYKVPYNIELPAKINNWMLKGNSHYAHFLKTIEGTGLSFYRYCQETRTACRYESYYLLYKPGKASTANFDLEPADLVNLKSTLAGWNLDDDASWRLKDFRGTIWLALEIKSLDAERLQHNQTPKGLKTIWTSNG